MTPAEVDAEYAATVSANKAATAKANRNTPTAPTEPEHLYRRKTTADEFVPIGGAPTDAPYESPAQRKTREAAEQEAIQAQVRKDQTQGYKRPDGTMVPPSVVTVDTVKQAAANATPPKSALERPANPMSAPNPASTQPAQDVLTQQDYLGDPAMQQHIQSGGAPIDQDLVQRARMQSDYEPAQPGVQKPGEVPNYMKPGGVPNHMQHLYDPANPEPPGYVSQQDYLGDPAMQQHIQSGGAPPSKASPQFDMPTDWKKYWNDIKNASEA
jgi:hypothetical protein